MERVDGQMRGGRVQVKEGRQEGKEVKGGGDTEQIRGELLGRKDGVHLSGNDG